VRHRADDIERPSQVGDRRRAQLLGHDVVRLDVVSQAVAEEDGDDAAMAESVDVKLVEDGAGAE